MTVEKARLGKAPRRGAGDVTFGQFFLEWLDYAGGEWMPKAREANRFHADRAIRRFGHLPLSKITPELLDREQQELLAHGKKTRPTAEPLSPKSVKETYTLVKAAFRQEKCWNRISVDPAADLQVPTIKRQHVEVLQEGELQDGLKLLADTREYALIVFAAASGCRRGEILALQLTDLNLTTGEVRINKGGEDTRAGIRIKRTKSGKRRSLELPDWALSVIREHLTMLSEERKMLGADYEYNGLLFPQRNGTYYKPDRIGGHINFLVKRFGIRTTLHGLLHFNASWQLNKKVPCRSSPKDSDMPIQLLPRPSILT